MARRPTRPRGASEKEPPGRIDDRALEAGPGASNEPVTGGGPGKVQDGDLQTRTRGVLAEGKKEEHQKHLGPGKRDAERFGPHEHLKRIVQSRQAGSKQGKDQK